MATSRRIELLRAVENRDVDSLMEVVNKLPGGAVKDSLAEFSRSQVTEFWSGTLSICISNLLSDDQDENTRASGASRQLDKMCEIISCITSLSLATVRCLLESSSEEQIPQSLQETAIILHGVLPTLPDTKHNVKDELCSLFEFWWMKELPSRAELMEHTIVHLLNRCIQDKTSSRASLSHLKVIEDVLASMDLTTEQLRELTPLLLQCPFNVNFLTHNKGPRFLATLFTLSEDLIEQVHMTVKNHLPHTPVLWHEPYGKMYLRAWEITSGARRKKVEEFCIQDLMNRAIHAQRQSGGMFKILFRLLTCIHKAKTQRGVENMLFRLYEPILWRALKATNSSVRLNAAVLMFDVFPLVDPTFNKEKTDSCLQSQFDKMQELLLDDCAEVRVVAVDGVGKVLNIFWELIPQQVIKTIMNILVIELTCDSASAAVRETVIRTMTRMCDNHLSVPMLQKILPQFKNFIFDSSEKVRIAMCDLLLRIMGMRAIKIWHVVPLGHLLSALAHDTDPVVRRIMRLLQPSFAPVDAAPSVQIERCISLIAENYQAARKFFTNLPLHISVSETAQYIVMICRYLLAMCHRSTGCNDKQTDDNDDTRKGTPVSHSKHRKTDENSPGAVANNEDDDSDVFQSDRRACSLDRQSLEGLVEGIYLMHTCISGDLSQPRNLELKEELRKKLTITVRELSTIHQTNGLFSALVGLASSLPEKAVSHLVRRLLAALNSCFETEINICPELALKSLILWGKTSVIVEVICESLKNVFQSDVLLTDQSNKNPRAQKKSVAFAASPMSLDPKDALNYILQMMGSAECRPVLLGRHTDSLMSVVEVLKCVKDKMRDLLDGQINGCSQQNLSLYLEIYTVYLRVSTFMCTRVKDEAEESFEKRCELANESIHSALTWNINCLIPRLEKEEECEKVKELASQVIGKTIKIIANMLLICPCSLFLLEETTQMCLKIVRRPWDNEDLTSQALACMFQLTQVRHLQETGESPKDMRIRDYKGAADVVHELVAAYRLHITQTSQMSGTGGGTNELSMKVPQILTTLSLTLGAILNELSSYCKPTDTVTDLIGFILGVMMQEMTMLAQQCAGEAKELPPLSATLTSIVNKSVGLKRQFLQELQISVTNGEIKDIREMSCVVSLLAALNTGERKKSDVPQPVFVSVKDALSKLPVTIDEDVFRDLKDELDTQLTKWISHAININGCRE